MDLWLIRVVLAVLTGISLHGDSFLYIYMAAMLLIVEGFNMFKKYRQQPHVVVYNWLFAGYAVFIFFIRTSHFQLHELVLAGINRIEHVLFAIVSFIMIFRIFFLLPMGHISNKKKTYLTFIIFNIFGIINELYQAWDRTGNMFAFSLDSWEDILTNLLAITAMCFILLRIFASEKEIKFANIVINAKS